MSPTNQLYKYNYSGKVLATLNYNYNGNISSIDVSNPMEIYVFYKEINRVLLLDNNLAYRGELDLTKLNITQAAAIARSFDNGIWVFDLGDLQFYPRGGFFRGYATVPFEATNLYLSACGNMTTTQGISAIIQGVSNEFSVYSNAGVYVANKFNEDFDYLSTIKSYRFQESLQNTDAFFDTVLGPILGDASASNNALGKRIYEKTANFVANNVSIDECNIDALDSMYQMAGESLQHFDSLNFAAPSDLRAQMDLCSIKHSKLWGARSTF